PLDCHNRVSSGGSSMRSSWFNIFFTPASVILVSVLGCLFLLLLITILLYKTRHKETIVNIWLLLFSSFITYSFVDLVSGYFLIRRLSPAMAADQYSHHKLVPNTRSQFKTRENGYVQTVNKLGLRGHDVQLEKPLGHYRILMLGDSF